MPPSPCVKAGGVCCNQVETSLFAQSAREPKSVGMSVRLGKPMPDPARRRSPDQSAGGQALEALVRARCRRGYRDL
jgi:hypothetical protein